MSIENAIIARVSCYLKFPDNPELMEVLQDADTKTVPITSLNMEFNLNSIPTATFVMLVGKSVQNTKKIQKGQQILNTIGAQVFVECYANIDGYFDYNIPWPNKEFKIFKGYITGFGYQRTNDAVSFTINAQHWIVNLDYSSALSADIESTAPDDFFKVVSNVSSNTLQLRESTTGNPLTATQITSDLWQSGLKEHFKYVVKNNQLNTAYQAIIGGVGNANEKLIEKTLSWMDNSKYMLLAPLDAQSKLAGQANWLANYLAAAVYYGNFGGTMFQKIIRLASSLAYIFVPTVETATLIPAVNQQGNYPWKKLRANEYSVVNYSGALPRPLKAVTMYSANNILSNQYANTIGNNATRNFIGIFNVSDLGQTSKNVQNFVTGDAGTVLIIHPPEFMSNDYIYAPGQLSNTTTTIPDITKIANSWCKIVFMREALKGRLGTVDTKLRFDICPGSTVRLMLAGDKLPVGNLNDEYITGTVVSVKTSINAQGRDARTVLTLTGLRTKKEEELGYVIDEHPLYDIPNLITTNKSKAAAPWTSFKFWPGSPLTITGVDEIDWYT